MPCSVKTFFWLTRVCQVAWYSRRTSKY